MGKGNDRAYIIKANGHIMETFPDNGTDFSLGELQLIVGGYIEIINFQDGTDRIMVINDEGKYEGLETNVAATQVAREASALLSGDYIVGDVLLCDSSQVR